MDNQFQPPQAPGMVRCEVTGKIVHESETVMFQGKRVSMEGKERLIELLKSGELLPGEMEKPTVSRRFGCMFVDGLIIGMVNMIMGVLVAGGAFFMGPSTNDPENMGVLILLQIINVSIYIGYYGVMHGLRGQTVGKMAGKLRVVNRDGSKITMKTAFLRSFYFAGVNLVSAIGMLGIFMFGPTGAIIGAITQMIAGIYVLANIVAALLDKAEQRALHDRFAGTRVIMDV